MTSNTDQIRQYLQALQISITDAIASADGKAKFLVDNWTRESGEGGGKTMVLTGGDVFEQAGVNFSEVTGDSLPASATAHRPELAGRNFRAMGV
jgi:coproporphyrinogen III oxidase